MNKISSIIVDDEKKAALNLAAMLKNYCSFIEVKAIANNTTDAFEAIQLLKPEVVFLDVEMPGESGLDLLRKFDTLNFELVFVTAYDKYALQALKVSATDFLLKPIDIDELKQAAEKLKERVELMRKKHTGLPGGSHKLIVSVREGVFFIEPAEIVFINADGSYSTLYLVDGCKHVVSKNIKEFENLLSGCCFFRTHISYLVNLNFVSRYYHDASGNFIEMKNGDVVEVSRRKKEEFLIAMKSI